MVVKQNAVVIEPLSEHKASVIWLHGLGADGHDFEPIVPELGLPQDHGIRFIFPHAPTRPVTINGGMVMRAWYDIRSPEFGKQEDTDAIKDSARLLCEYIDAEISSGIPSEKVLLAGFSQGGAIILYTGLRYSQSLAGLLALSTYLPLVDQFLTEANSANICIPIMMMHGTFDPVIPLYMGQQSYDLLEQTGYSIEWRDYPMQHAVCPQEIQEISNWLQARLLVRD